MKTILDKINKAYEIEANKTELAKHEIELANVKEIPARLKKLVDTQKKLDKILPQIEKLLIEKKDAQGLLNIYIKESSEYLREVDSQVKQLGLDVSSIPSLKQFQNEVENSKSYINK